MYTIPNKQNNKYYMDKLIEIHDQLKNHKFREIFHDDTNKLTWTAQCENFRKLVYESTEIISHMAYYNNDENPIINIPDTNWIHDFRGFLLRFYNIFIFDKDWMNEYQEDLGMSIREFYQTMGLTDINHCMLFFDRYIQYLHQFIETGRFIKIAAVNNIPYKRGWCKLVFMDYEKHDDGKWYWVE